MKDAKSKRSLKQRLRDYLSNLVFDWDSVNNHLVPPDLVEQKAEPKPEKLGWRYFSQLRFWSRSRP
jgi:hypothetical protein